MPRLVVAAFYQFTRLIDPQAVRTHLAAICAEAGTSGTILVAREGLNGTIAGTRDAIDTVLAALRGVPGCAALEHKESPADSMPFHRMKVKLKREIVTMGVPDIDPNTDVGAYVEPQDWNRLISEPDVVVIDTRNDYEVAIGTFEGAVNPETAAFRDFPNWFRATYGDRPNTRFAMFCTGGIRCEKATAFLKAEGVAEVFHLKGGILKYLETMPESDSLWQGECFVFDQRTAVRHGLEPGSYDQCHACRRPISDADKASPLYEPGVSCPHCHAAYTPDQKARFGERQRQMEHAERRGYRHLGADQSRRGKTVSGAG